MAACQAAFSFVEFSIASSNVFFLLFTSASVVTESFCKSSNVFFLLFTSVKVVPPSNIVSSMLSTSVCFKFIATCSEGVISDFVSIL